jgi:hypothetical protein
MRGHGHRLTGHLHPQDGRPVPPVPPVPDPTLLLGRRSSCWPSCCCRLSLAPLAAVSFLALAVKLGAADLPWPRPRCPPAAWLPRRMCVRWSPTTRAPLWRGQLPLPLPSKATSQRQQGAPRARPVARASACIGISCTDTAGLIKRPPRVTRSRKHSRPCMGCCGGGKPWLPSHLALQAAAAAAAVLLPRPLLGLACRCLARNGRPRRRGVWTGGAPLQANTEPAPPLQHHPARSKRKMQGGRSF